MVLPYGGTREAIRQAVKASVLDQLGVLPGEKVESPWHRVEEEGYAAFKDRNLEDHPLFNEDIRLLSGLIHQSITPAIPRAMAAMDTLQKIGSWVGPRALAWRTGPWEKEGMWVVQAKSKATRKQVTMKGYHLPDVIRRLTLVTQTNEVDPRAHRTGIVANFIHSLDAEHLARTVHKFKAAGGSCVGVIHDCVMCRPSEVSIMHRALREAFMEMYMEDPLKRPVRVIHTEGLDEGKVLEYATWHDLAVAAGTSFPEPGAWKPSEVLDSQWFFS
jgi:DNA-directed RNA polymerase